MRLRLKASLPFSLPEIEVPFQYAGYGRNSDLDYEGHALVSMDDEELTYEMGRYGPSDLDRDYVLEQIRDWMQQNYPGYQEVR